MTSDAPYLFLDIDGVLHGTHMKYGYERTVVVRERIPREQVHPALRPRSMQARPDYLERRRPAPSHVTFNTRMRVSPKLLGDLDELGLDVRMLTTWLEHDSVDAFFAQGPTPQFRFSKLAFTGRDVADPLGTLPERWKVDQLHLAMAQDEKPFIWVDDDEVPMWRDEIEATYPDIPKLLIAPTYDVGLTPGHVEGIRDFLDAVATQ